MANLASRRFRKLRKSIGSTQGKPRASPSHERKSICHIPLTRKWGDVLIPLFPAKLFHQWVPPAQIPAGPHCLLLLLLLLLVRGSWSLPGVTPLSFPWLQVLLTFRPLPGPAEWFIGALPCCPCSCLVEFLWTSPIFWSRGSTPFHFQISDFSNNLSILRPASLVKSLCKHKPQADLFKSLCNSWFPSACQTTQKDPLSVSGFFSISLFPPGVCPALMNLLKIA